MSDARIRLAQGERVLIKQRSSERAVAWDAVFGMLLVIGINIIIGVVATTMIDITMQMSAPTSAQVARGLIIGGVAAGAGMVVIGIYVAHMIFILTYQVVVTTRRVYESVGWLGRYDDEVMLHKVISVETYQGPMERMMGYGNVRVFVPGGSMDVRNMVNHQNLARHIEAAIAVYQKRYRDEK